MYGRPLGILVMGVCGSGKSTVAAALSQRLGLPWLDADTLHAPEAVARMRAGIALRDEDRWPWLDRVGERLAAAPGTYGMHDPGAAGGLVVACSALRRVYRDRLRHSCPTLHVLCLDGDEALLAQRLATRPSHYMAPSLLASQLQTLERPQADEAHVVTVDIAEPVDAVVARALAGWSMAAGAEE
jgi:gluconokinase